jgi:tetratricopeptide (TPR) repeat protein
MYRSSWFLTAALVATSVALVQPAASAKSASEIKEIARSVTVEIKFERYSGRIPGIIIGKQGNLYTLVANYYLLYREGRGVYNAGELTLHLPDGIKYQVSIDAIKLLNKSSNPVDLALVQFRSDRNYKVAQLATPNSLKSKDTVYTAGFYSDREKVGLDTPHFNFEEGKAVVSVNKRLIDDDGYTFVYDTDTGEMNGGGVFNSNGQLVAIYGHDRYWLRDFAKRAIPIPWLVQNLAELGINLGAVHNFSSSRATPAQLPTTADDYYIAGLNEFSTNRAVKKFSVAIQLNPKYQRAYFARARAISSSNMIGKEDTKRAISDFSQAILLDPKDYRAYYYRSYLMENAQKAIKDLDQAILFNPKFSIAYFRRAELKSDYLKDFQGALADYNQTILIDPNNYDAYKNRAALKVEKLNDISGALVDYNQIILLYPKTSYKIYSARANLREQLGDLQGAAADRKLAKELQYKVNFPDASGTSRRSRSSIIVDPNRTVGRSSDDYHRRRGQ